jgi:4-amino-4-deoxy-L-arabinose transferase-like glycosyltransferase
VDADSYDAVALQIVRHPSLDSFSPVFPPGFVGIIALLYAAFGHSLVIAKTLLWICLVIAAILSGVLARRLYASLAAGWIAAFLTASSASLRAYTGTLQYEVLVAALILCLILLALRISTARDRAEIVGPAFSLAVALGLALLIRETLVVLVPVFTLFVAQRVTRAATIQIGVIAGAIVLCVTAAPTVAWSTYQSHRTGRTMLIRQNVQGILPFGHNPYANGTWNVALSGIGEPAGMRFIVSEPRRELWLAWRKAMYFWGVLRDGWNVPRPGAVWVAKASAGILPLDWILPFARGGWILVALALGCSLWRRSQWRDWWLLPALIGSLMFVHLVTISSHRFAVPILPLAFIVIAGPFARVVAWLRTPGLVAVFVLVAVGTAMQLFEWPIRYRLNPTELDGVDSENRHEADGRDVRFSSAAYGRRVSWALYDEYLPGGRLLVKVRARRGTTDRPDATPIARIRLVLLDDSSHPCDSVVTIGQLSTADRWTELRVSCSMPHDGTARLIAETFGRVDLAFSDITLQWPRR